MNSDVNNNFTTNSINSTTNYTTTVAYQLRDIRGLDPVSWWPPALGWWLVTFGLFFSLWLTRRFLPHLHSRTLSQLAWTWEARRELRTLRKRAYTQATYVTAKELSEILRRIAMARCGRAACAGLTGAAWLDWLKTHDPTGYAWTERGQLLLLAPYAPPQQAAAELPQLLELLDATATWATNKSQHQELKANV